MPIYGKYTFGYDKKGRHITDSILGPYYWEQQWFFYRSGSETAATWLWQEPGVMWC